MSNYFCGWYFKCQAEDHTLAIIPASHCSDGKKSNTIQLITDNGSKTVFFPYECLRKENHGFSIGENYFGSDGAIIHLSSNEFTAVGRLHFGAFSPIRYDIMGPFRYVPFMECRHIVKSMYHTVNGNIEVNGVNYRFQNASGYIEGDRGRSFPKEYAWCQCFIEGGSLMLSVANIPIGVLNFTGIIGVILYQGKEHRIATYLGARAEKIEHGEIVIRQGNKELSIKLIKKNALPLSAPTGGAMQRTIHESAAGRAAFCFKINGETVFDFERNSASFEYEYNK